MKISKLTFIGGPRDGQELEMVSPILPDVIDGDNGIHLFGSDTYVIVEANWDEGTAIYEHIKLYNVIKEDSANNNGGDGALAPTNG